MNETAWDYCRECLYYNADCNGTFCDFLCPEGDPPCKNYEYKDEENEE